MTAGAPSNAEVRFVHTSITAPGLDFYLNGAGAAYDVGFSTFTSYLGVSPGTYNLSANRANTGQALTAARSSFVAAHQYTAIVSRPLGNLQERVYEDQETPAAAGQIAVRVIHEADGAGPLDVFLLALQPNVGPATAVSPLVSGLAPGTASGYFNVPLVPAYAVGVLRSGGLPVTNARSVLTGVTVRGGSGAVRTVVITENGMAGGNGLYGFVLDDVDPL